MTKYKQPAASQETQDDALAMAKKVQKPGQTKEQTKLIALGIQKGIAEYKKSVKSKQRDIDKAKKKKAPIADEHSTSEITENKPNSSTLPWALLALSWIGFVSYHFLT